MSFGTSPRTTERWRLGSELDGIAATTDQGYPPCPGADEDRVGAVGAGDRRSRRGSAGGLSACCIDQFGRMLARRAPRRARQDAAERG